MIENAGADVFGKAETGEIGADGSAVVVHVDVFVLERDDHPFCQIVLARARAAQASILAASLRVYLSRLAGLRSRLMTFSGACLPRLCCFAESATLLRQHHAEASKQKHFVRPALSTVFANQRESNVGNNVFKVSESSGGVTPDFPSY